MLNIGFIGFGKSTNRYHLPYLLIRNNFKVKTIYSRNRKYDVEKLYEGKEINFTDNLDKILNDKEIELVSVCTPPKTHFDFAMKCLKAGKHVLVEKPFCVSIDETIELLSYAKERKLIIMSYQNRRFDSDFLTTKKIIDEGILGEIVEIESHLDYFRPITQFLKGEFFDGAFYGLGVHTLDQIISIYGRQKKFTTT